VNRRMKINHAVTRRLPQVTHTHVLVLDVGLDDEAVRRHARVTIAGSGLQETR
jgi:hypothetical protein